MILADLCFIAALVLSQNWNDLACLLVWVELRASKKRVYSNIVPLVRSMKHALSYATSTRYSLAPVVLVAGAG